MKTLSQAKVGDTVTVGKLHGEGGMDLRKSWNHSNLYRDDGSNRSDLPQSDSSAQAGQILLRM